MDILPGTGNRQSFASRLRPVGDSRDSISVAAMETWASKRRYSHQRTGSKVNFCPATDTSYMNPPLTCTKTAMPFT